MGRNLAEVLKLVLVTDDELVAGRDLVELCRAAERGGVTAVQLRLKRPDALHLAEAARALLAALQVPLFVNDRLDVALAVGAAGAHLGPDDMPVAMARRIVPDGFVVGASVGSPAEVAQGKGADYWGVGPYRVTATKEDAGAPIGIEGFEAVRRLAPAGVPCVAIGGVRPEDVREVLAAGGAGVAVVRGILGEEDVEAAARAYAVNARLGSGASKSLG
jgi:thiamine-phosphate pyrophosphorylase